MPYLKVYEWEDKRWPRYQTLFIDGHPAQRDFLGELAMNFGTDWPVLSQSYRRGSAKGIGGCYRWAGSYGVIYTGKRATLATLIHEYAHHLCRCTVPKDQRSRSHGRAFKKSLKLSYAAARRLLVPMKSIIHESEPP